MTRPRSVAAMLVLVLAGCGDGSRTLENVGSVCVMGEQEGDSPETSYVENAPVDITVVLDDCLSGCAEDIEASCSIELDGTNLRVSASGTYSVQPGGAVCPAVCVAMTATCTSEPLAAGTYSVEYAGESTTFEVPSMGPPAQIGDTTCGY